MPTFRQKALTYYRDQNLRILQAITPEGDQRPTYIEARVRGFQAIHEVKLDAAVWTCTCDDGHLDDCAHRAAVRMATGYRSTAERPVRA